MADRFLNTFFGIIAVLVLVSVIRNRLAKRQEAHDIQPSDISPDLSAGEELLEDVLRAQSNAKPL